MIENTQPKIKDKIPYEKCCWWVLRAKVMSASKALSYDGKASSGGKTALPCMFWIYGREI